MLSDFLKGFVTGREIGRLVEVEDELNIIENPLLDLDKNPPRVRELVSELERTEDWYVNFYEQLEKGEYSGYSAKTGYFLGKCSRPKHIVYRLDKIWKGMWP